MPDKSPSSYEFITYLWVIGLAAWGGVVQFLSKLKSGHARPFNIVEFLGDIVVSAFVGITTFWLCEASGIEPLYTAAMVGVSGHMGCRILYKLEQWLCRRFFHS